jgi:hypothetical protein
VNFRPRHVMSDWLEENTPAANVALSLKPLAAYWGD